MRDCRFCDSLYDAAHCARETRGARKAQKPWALEGCGADLAAAQLSFIAASSRGVYEIYFKKRDRGRAHSWRDRSAAAAPAAIRRADAPLRFTVFRVSVVLEAITVAANPRKTIRTSQVGSRFVIFVQRRWKKGRKGAEIGRSKTYFNVEPEFAPVFSDV